MSALWDRYGEAEKLRNYRAGLAAAAVYNVNRGKGVSPVNPLCFFEPEKPAHKCLSAQEIANKLNAVHAACKRKI